MDASKRKKRFDNHLKIFLESHEDIGEKGKGVEEPDGKGKEVDEPHDLPHEGHHDGDDRLQQQRRQGTAEPTGNHRKKAGEVTCWGV